MENKLNLEQREPYFKAFWACEVLDRVAVSVTATKNPGTGLPEWLSPHSVYNFSNDQLLDHFESAAHDTFYGGLAIPFVWQNFGPDVFSAFLGADLKFSKYSKDTSWIDWSAPALKDYSDLSALEIKDTNPFYRRMLDFTRHAIERSRGRYLVGLTDLHGGFDALAALRGGPENASMDLVDDPDGVQAAMKELHLVWKKIIDDFYAITENRQNGTLNWMSIWAPGKMYPVQSDFSCLVSPRMYREFLLDELVNEIDYMDYSLYHLDGVEALQHLDILLDIPKLNVIQWVRGAKYENEPISIWFDLYKKIQAKHKAIVVYPKPHEIPEVLANLKPEGLLIQCCARDEAEARQVLKMCGW